MTSLQKLADELAPHHNEMCLLYDTDIVRLIGVGRDNMDLYYIVKDKNRPRGDEVFWASAVGALQPLKGLLDARDYERMSDVNALNGAGKAPIFKIEDRYIWDDDASTKDNAISRCGRFALRYDPENSNDRFSLWRCHPDDADAEDFLILNGEFAVLEDLATRMIAEMTEWAALRADRLS